MKKFLQIIIAIILFGCPVISYASNIPFQQTLSTTNATIYIPANGDNLVTFTTSGTWVGSISAYGSVDGQTGTPTLLNIYPFNGGTAITAVTTNAMWQVPVSGAFRVTLVMTSYTSGMAVVGVSSSQGAIGAGIGAFPTPIPFPAVQPVSISSPVAVTGAFPTPIPFPADSFTINNSLSMSNISNAVTVNLNGSTPITRFSVVYGTATGSVIFEGQLGDGNWTVLPVKETSNILNNQGAVLSAGIVNTTGIYSVSSNGYSQVRIRCSTTGTGSITIAYSTSSLPNGFNDNSVTTSSGVLATTVSLLGFTPGNNLGSGTGLDVINYPGVNPVNINLSDGTTATTTQLVAGVANKKIHVFSYDIRAVGSPVVLQLVEGSGTNCMNGTTNVSSRWIYQTTGESIRSNAYPIYDTVTPGDSLCVVSSGTITEYDVDLSVFLQ